MGTLSLRTRRSYDSEGGDVPLPILPMLGLRPRSQNGSTGSAPPFSCLATTISLHLISCPNSLSTSSFQTGCSQLIVLKLNLPTFFWCLRTFNGSPLRKVPTPSVNMTMWRPLDHLPLFPLRKPLLSFNCSTCHVEAELSFWDLCLLTSPSGHLSE